MALLTLTEAKTALSLEDSDAAIDATVQSFVDAVTRVVETEVGFLEQRSHVFEIRQGGYAVALPGRNVVSLTSGVEIRSGAAVDVTSMYVDQDGLLRCTDGYSLPLCAWRLTALVGLATIPENIKRGAAEVLIEAWETQRASMGSTPRPFLVSYRAAAWFAGDTTVDGFA